MSRGFKINMGEDNKMVETTKAKNEKRIWCDRCKESYCLNGYQDRKPDYCQAAANPDLLF